MEIYNFKPQIKVGIAGDAHLRGNNPRCRTDNYLEAILAKIEYIIKENDIIIFLGDLFDKPSVDEEVLHAFIILLQMYNKPAYSIFGNHDLWKYSIVALNKTAFGIMLVKGLLKHLNTGIQIHNTVIKEIPFNKHFKDAGLPEHDNQTILLGHYFLNSEIDPKYSLHTDQILEQSKAPVILLGHDHEPHKPEQIGNTLVLRNGSLCRNTNNAYNNRIPNYTQFTITEDKVSFEVKPVLVAKKPEEIFVDSFFNRKKKEKKKVISLDHLLADFGSKELEKISVIATMQDLKAQERNIQYLKQMYENIGESVN